VGLKVGESKAVVMVVRAVGVKPGQGMEVVVREQVVLGVELTEEEAAAVGVMAVVVKVVVSGAAVDREMGVWEAVAMVMGS